MKSILLIGLGRFGRHIADELNKLNNHVMAVDRDEARVNSVLSFVTNAQIGNSTDRDFLAGLGIGNYDASIVAIGDDFQSSLETTSLLKELGAQHVIARATTDVHEKFLLRNGADEVIYPEKELAKWTAVKCSSNSVRDFIPIDNNGNYSIFEITIPAGWLHKSLIQLDLRKKYGINVLGLRQADGNVDMYIRPEAELTGDMTLFVAGETKQVKKLLHI